MDCPGVTPKFSQDNVFTAGAVIVKEVCQAKVRCDDDPDVTLPAAFPVIVLRLDKDLVVRLVTTKILVFPDSLLHGPVQVLEQPCRLLQEAVGCLLVQVEAVLVEVGHDALHGHRVEIAQLGNACDERAVEAGVLERRERRLGADKTSGHLHRMDMEHFLDEPRRDHPVADRVADAERLRAFGPFRIDIPLHGLHLEVHVAAGAVVAPDLAFFRLAVFLRLLLFLCTGRCRQRLLLLALVFHELGQAPHPALGLGQTAIPFL